MKTALRLTVIILLLAVSSLCATTHYVSLASTNPTPPYTNWVTAATNIQDAVDAAGDYDEVVVTNGVYTTGGRPGTDGDSASRVFVDKEVALRSVNGPYCTVIVGSSSPWTRCVELSDSTSLTGFTLTGGTAYVGGGVSGSSAAFVTNCVIVGNSAPGYTADGFGGGARGCVLYNCVLSGNSATWAGGGVAISTLYNCTVTGNSVDIGVGGVSQCALYNCIVYYNTPGSFPPPRPRITTPRAP